MDRKFRLRNLETLKIKSYQFLLFYIILILFREIPSFNLYIYTFYDTYLSYSECIKVIWSIQITLNYSFTLHKKWRVGLPGSSDQGER